MANMSRKGQPAVGDGAKRSPQEATYTGAVCAGPGTGSIDKEYGDDGHVAQNPELGHVVSY
jgi:hypothetical protein